MSKWKEINRYRVGNTEGKTEEILLEKDNEGNFRVINDYGNKSFEFERMSGHEFFRKVDRDITEDLEREFNHVWNTDVEEPTVYDDNNCIGDIPGDED